jgi:hypothetical protein
MLNRKFLWVLLLVSFFFSGGLLVLLLNGGGALDDSRSEVQRLRERSNLSLELVRQAWQGRSLSELRAALEKVSQNVDSTEPGVIEVGQIRFEYKDDLIVHITYFD